MDVYQQINELNAKFSTKSVIFGTWQKSDLPTVCIANAFCRGAISLFGAHILSYEPKGQKEVIMVSPSSKLEAPTAIRGGIPVCWPWFGSTPKPSHGVARIQFWEFVSAKSEADGSDTITMQLSVKEPHDLKIVLTANFGAKLSIRMTTTNTGSDAFILGDALHTYFQVGEITRTFIHGMGGCTVENRLANTEFTCPDVFGFEAETDNIYHSTAAVTIEDKEWNRKILVEKSGSKTSVVWNPWAEKAKKMADFGDEDYHHMVCVEAANCSIDKIDLAPGATHTLEQKISVL